MDIAILINSCDNYSKIWPTFFEVFIKFWPECPYTLYLNTEKKQFVCKGLNVITLNSLDDNKSWSYRLKNAVKRIDSEFIITFLDDFILEESVNEKSLNKITDYIGSNRTIGVIQFTVGTAHSLSSIDYPELKLQDKRSKYRINCQAAIWRKDYLLKILREFESPWEFEKYGSLRSRRYKEKVFSWSSENDYIFTYNWGKPIIGGKWNLDEIDRLEDKLGIKFDLSERETMRNYYQDLKNKPRPKRDIKWFISKIKHVRSLV